MKDWLSNDSSDGRVRALTGKPGSGKSAVLAQLVLAAASAPIPGERPPTPIDVAFHAHGKNPAQLVAQISAGLGAPSATAAVVVESLARETRKRVLLIDALDEASDIGGIVDLILKLAVAAPALRILLSAREDAFKRFPKSACVMLDLDDQRYWDHEDIRRYVERRLLEDQDSPYRRAAELVADLAETIAARADRSFLIAQVMTRILTRSKLMPPPAAVDLSGIAPGDLSEVFNRDLERFGDDREKVRDLLRPLAYAEGAGLPWETLWAATASAISGHLYRDSDVRWLHEHASSYFIEDRESGYSVYRPYHQDFADFLCEPSRELDVQRLITAQLRANAPARDDGARDWARALPYVRSHLSAHAARAGQLDAPLTIPLFWSLRTRTVWSSTSRRPSAKQGRLRPMSICGPWTNSEAAKKPSHALSRSGGAPARLEGIRQSRQRSGEMAVARPVGAMVAGGPFSRPRAARRLDPRAPPVGLGRSVSRCFRKPQERAEGDLVGGSFTLA